MTPGGSLVRVLYVIDDLAPCGAEGSLLALAPHLASRGVRLEVAYLRERAGLQGALERAGAEVFSVAGAGGRPGWTTRLWRLCIARRPDIVHTTLFESDVAGRVAGFFAGVPVVCSLVNVPYGPEQLNDPRLRAWKVRAAQSLDAATARVVVRWHAISRYVADRMAARLRIARERIDVVTRGRDPTVLGRPSAARAAAARARLGVDPAAPLVLAVARHERQKGLDILLDAFTHVLREFPRARLVVAGREGNETASLRRQRTARGLHRVVALDGARDDVPELLCAADATVLPSRWEGLGSVLLEAMALRSPIVASDLPAVREILRDGDTALLVTPERPYQLAAALTHALRDRAGSERRAARARADFLARHTVERVADEMLEFYARALAGRHGAPAPIERAPRVGLSADVVTAALSAGSGGDRAAPSRVGD
jgi:glycosyltransferase involved in cell wall biosynthesis